MDHLLSLAQTLASFALVLGVLVSIHELGHYAAARWCRVGVEAFSIGFGPTLKSWTDKHGTEWKLSMLPLGGYVKMHGMAGEDAAADGGQAEEIRPQDAFTHKKVWQRAVISAAGPAANFALAIVLFGAMQATIGAQVALPVVGTVVDGSAAAAAGIKPGDAIVSIAGAPITTFEDLRGIVAASPDRDLVLGLRRDGHDLALKVHVHGVGPNHATGQLGVQSGKIITVRRGPLQAAWGGVTETWHQISQTYTGLAGLIMSGTGAENLGGPIAIAHLSGQVAKLGIVSLIDFIAMMSVQLGLLNLLPIPILDGGHLLFLGAEALRGRPLPARAQEYGYRLGMAIIATVFIFVSFNDLAREGVFAWMHHLAG